MTALAAGRPSSVKTVTREVRPLAAGAKVWKGGLAIAITGVGSTSRGYYKQGDATSVGIAVGRFYADADNTAGADGDVSVDIHFLQERSLLLLNNDGGTAVVVADRESGCYVFDDQTVSQVASAQSVAGVVYDVTSEGVWVEVGARLPVEQVFPRIQTGTSTLVAGTKSITGVQLTANSRIAITMKDPGAGAITGFGAFRTPAASRNVGAGSFVVDAIDDAKAVIATAVCTFDWMIIG